MSCTTHTASGGASALGLSIGQFCNSAEYAAKITPGQIVTRKVHKQPAERNCTIELARASLKANGYNGKMSSRTRANVVGMLAEWFSVKKAESGRAFTQNNQVARRFTFVTLTLCAKQMHTDNYLKRHALGRFILECERRHGVRDYFWRAEPQNNGNIHFHLLLATEIPWRKVRDYWNCILDSLGYLEQYTHKMYNMYCSGFKVSGNQYDKRTKEQQYKAYQAGVKARWRDPNSTDIHRLEKTKNAAAYVCKYVSKDEGSRKIEGRIWGCSDSLRALKTPQFEVTAEFLQAMQQAAESGQIELVQLEHVAVYRGNVPALLAALFPQLLADLEQHYRDKAQQLRNFSRAAT